jgi:hypothetical protein
MPTAADHSMLLIALAVVAFAAVAPWAIVRIWHSGPVKRYRRRRRTARAAAAWDRPAVARPRPVRSRVVVSMTASPGRMESLERTVRTLLNQTCPPDEVHINIPHVFRRTGEQYSLPAWCGSIDPRVRVFRVEDVGPATKMLHTVASFGPEEDVVLAIADDDVLYLQVSLEVLLRALHGAPGAVHGFSGYGFGPAWESVLAKGNARVQVIEGWACFVAHRRAFGTGFGEYMARAAENRACFCHDDVVVSNWFELQGVPRMQVEDSAVNRRRMRRLGAQLDFGYLPGSLHQESPGSQRARESAAHLASLGLWRLASPAAEAVNA